MHIRHVRQGNRSAVRRRKDLIFHLIHRVILIVRVLHIDGNTFSVHINFRSFYAADHFADRASDVSGRQSFGLGLQRVHLNLYNRRGIFQIGMNLCHILPLFQLIYNGF